MRHVLVGILIGAMAFAAFVPCLEAGREFVLCVGIGTHLGFEPPHSSDVLNQGGSEAGCADICHGEEPDGDGHVDSHTCFDLSLGGTLPTHQTRPPRAGAVGPVVVGATGSYPVLTPDSGAFCLRARVSAFESPMVAALRTVVLRT